MESKNKFWKGALVGALVTAFAGLIVVGMSMGIFMIGRTAIDETGRSQTVQAGGQTGKLDMAKIGAKMEMIQEVVDQYFLWDEDAGKVEDGIYKGMLYGLDDPYTVYYTADEYQKLMENTTGNYCGIGVMISQNRATGIITTVQVFKNTPGYEAGIKPGDIIYKVGDMEVTGMDMDLLVKDYIKGEEGTPVTITILRPETNEFMDMTMKRAQVEVETVAYRMMEDKAGYISVSQFEEVTLGQFKEAVDALEKQGMEKLVVDLRNNPGGILDTVVGMLDYILPDNLTIAGDPGLKREKSDKTLLVYMSDKNGKGKQYYCSDGHQVDVPMVVLVNGESASASEVFAGAVKDYRHAKLVGTQTFGKGIVQNLIPLDNGTAIKLTTAHYFTPVGFDLHGKGLEPDVKVELDEELKSKVEINPEEDNQLQKALEVLKGMEK